jgi:hypothetical protein
MKTHTKFKPPFNEKVKNEYTPNIKSQTKKNLLKSLSLKAIKTTSVKLSTPKVNANLNSYGVPKLKTSLSLVKVFNKPIFNKIEQKDIVKKSKIFFIYCLIRFNSKTR